MKKVKNNSVSKFWEGDIVFLKNDFRKLNAMKITSVWVEDGLFFYGVKYANGRGIIVTTKKKETELKCAYERS